MKNWNLYREENWPLLWVFVMSALDELTERNIPCGLAFVIVIFGGAAIIAVALCALGYLGRFLLDIAITGLPAALMALAQ